MSLRTPCCLLVCLLTAAIAGAAAPALPPIDGSFSGSILPFGDAGEMKLGWTLSAATRSETDRSARLELKGPGTSLKARARIELPEGKGRWVLTEGEAEIAPWWSALAATRFPELKSIEAAGRVTLSGGGAIAASPGDFSGELRAALHHGAVSNQAKTWSVDGLEAVVIWPHLPDLATAVQQRLTFVSGAVGEIALRNGLAEFELVSSSQLRVRSVSVEALGGTLRCGGFDLDLSRPELAVTLSVEGLELGALRPYLPQAVADAQGRMDGQLTLRWSRENGFSLGNGDLRLRADAPSTIRLAPAPGFLSSHVPARFDLAPAWMGALGRLFSQENPAQKTLQAIELGEEALIVESVSAELRPDNLGTGSTATVKIVARPTHPEAVKVLRLNVRVSGPLADVVRFGMDGRVSLGR